MILGLVPARKGSKGIPRKNLKRLGRRPLIEYTLDAALGAKTLDVVAVTTDDPGVARLARRRRAEVVDRPKKWAQDRSPILPAMTHALETLESRGKRFDTVVLLQPTCPFRNAKHVDEAVRKFRRSGAKSLVSVHPASEHPCEMFTIQKGKLSPAVRRPARATGRQGFPSFYFLNGAIYVTRVSEIRKGSIWSDRSAVYEMPAASGVDIDVESDWWIAEGLLKSRARNLGVKA